MDAADDRRAGVNGNKHFILQLEESAAPRARPQRVVAVEIHRPDALIGQSLSWAVVLEQTVLQAIHTIAVGADPEFAFVAFAHGHDTLVRQSLVLAVTAEDGRLEPGQARPLRAHPELALPIFVDRADQIAGQTVLRREMENVAVGGVPKQSAAVSADP